MKPTRALIQIGDDTPITVTVDHIELIEDRPIAAITPRLRLTLEFPLTPEFTDWWRTLVCPGPQDHAGRGSCELCDGAALRAAVALGEALESRAAARAAGGEQR